MKVDGWQYASIFSSELIVAFAAIIVAGFNIWFFHFSSVGDNSLAMRLLRNHSTMNNQLVLHNNTIRTVVVRPGFFQEAYADTILPSDGSEDSDPDNVAYEPNVIAKPNPDSIQKLISQQVTVYTTESGDTLSSIAKKFKISIDSIKASNNIGDKIKPGWYLLIPPVNGVVVKITDSNTTIPDLAKKYNVTAESIVVNNGREIIDGRPNLEDIPSVNEYLIIKGGKITPPPAPKPAVIKNGKNGKVTIPKIASILGGHLFPPGYCTWYVATKTKVPWGGNGGEWGRNAAKMGYTFNHDPGPGDILVTNESRVGHVAYIESVVGDNIHISEMNYVGFNKKSTRVINKNSSVIKGVIQMK
jgi:surface antigen